MADINRGKDKDILLMEKEIRLDEIKIGKKRQQLRIIQAKKEVERLTESLKASDDAIESLELEIEELKNGPKE